MKLSACLVVRNEVQRIGECLHHLRPLVDEIVLVDQSSDDGTVEVVKASQLVDRIAVDAPHGYCEASRGLSDSLATGDWRLVIDADERLTDDFARDLRILLESPLHGYRLFRRLYLDNVAVWEGDSHYRLFRKDRVIFLNELHTEPQPTSLRIHTPPYIAIDHFKSTDEHAQDKARYLALLDGPKPPTKMVSVKRDLVERTY